MAKTKVDRYPDAFQLFCYATAYWKGRWAMHRELKVRYPYNTPIFVVESFSLELHLKCLIRVRRNPLPPKYTHEPQILYGELKERDRLLIRKHMGLKQRDVEAILVRARGVFAKLRYKYEGHDWEKDFRGKWANKGFDKMIHAIRDIIKSVP